MRRENRGCARLISLPARSRRQANMESDYDRMTEKPKRVPPSRHTVRELYLKSGNRCAFPGCQKFLFNETGTFIGEICHIEAAEPGGERFNPNQSNAERASFANLLLMCHDHHVQTDNVEKFDVARMRRIKAEHERLYSDVVGKMLLKVADHTKHQDAVWAKNLQRMNEVLKWGHSDEELTESLADLNEFVARLTKVPVPAREMLQIIVERSEKSAYGGGLETQVPEVLHATGLSIDELRGICRILDKYNFIGDKGQDEGIEMIGLQTTKEGWPIFADLKKFCSRSGTDLGEIIVGLDFSVLDK